MQKLFTAQIKKALAKYPTYSQDGKGMDAIVIARFFVANATWYVLEGVDENTVYGLVNLGYGWEYGYISIKELESIRVKGYFPVERDICVPCAKQTLRECMAENNEMMDV